MEVFLIFLSTTMKKIILFHDPFTQTTFII